MVKIVMNKSARYLAKNPHKVAEYRENKRLKYREDPERQRREVIKQRYGITLEKFDEMVASQNGLCAICETDTPGGRWDRWSVDHCHTTGKIRGILCHSCNTGIGALNDDIDRLRKAIGYLEHYS
ncbi:endonuclease VII domain-containing protein [Mesorhizobium sp. M0618]|uniref:endonuclease VII domain-containing protein n=1 Tax=Mesorhizobium sp. M0618 TaxID=2956972 RepID=UPI0033350D0A